MADCHFPDESEFLKAFPTYHLHRRPDTEEEVWVFCSQDEGGGCQNKSSSADCQTTGTIQDKIKSALSSTKMCYDNELLLQFWAPVEIGGRQLLSTSGQPFAVNRPCNRLLRYRQRSTEYQYDIFVNYRQDGEENEQSNLMIITGGPPATAFINRLPHKVDNSKDKRDPLTQYAFESVLEFSIMLPVCCPSQSSSSCIGVIEYSAYDFEAVEDIKWINRALKEADLSIFDVQELIPYKTLQGLEPARDQIRSAIEIVCESEKLLFAQVWIAYYEDENQVPVLSSSEHARKKQMLALKLTGYECDTYFYGIRIWDYCDLCDMVPLDKGCSLVEKTLQDYESRFINLTDDMYSTEVNIIVIWLRSIDTGDFGYAFEFFWCSDNNISLEDLLLKLKGYLPSFKFASGAELGDELHVIDVENSTESDIKRFKIFEGKGESSIREALEEGEMNCKSAPIDIPGEDIELQFEQTQKEAAKNLEDVGNSTGRDSKRFKIQALEEGKKPAVVEDKESLKAKHKTAPIELPKSEIVKRFRKTQKDAAKDLEVSLSTLKRKCKEYGIYEWPGPLKPGRKKVNHFRNQSGTIEEDTGASLVPSALERDENNLTIKALHSIGSNDMIRFELPMSEVTFKSVEKEIVKEFKLIPGTYKIEYCDKEDDWILLTLNCDMNYCIRSSKDSHKNIFRLRVRRVSPSV